MHPKVRDLYKRLVFVGRDYPLGLEWVRRKAKLWFRQHRAVSDDLEILKLVKTGRHWVREMEHIIQMRKMRTLKRNYDVDFYNNQEKQLMEQVEQMENSSLSNEKRR